MKKFLKIIGNKYVIATLVFAVLILFLDEYNLMVTGRVSRQVRELHEEESSLREAIVADSVAAAELKTSMDAKEHFARENYYMKRPDEDIFVIK